MILVYYNWINSGDFIRVNIFVERSFLVLKKGEHDDCLSKKK